MIEEPKLSRAIFTANMFVDNSDKDKQTTDANEATEEISLDLIRPKSSKLDALPVSNAHETLYRALANAFIIREIPQIEIASIDDTIIRPKSSQVLIQKSYNYFS